MAKRDDGSTHDNTKEMMQDGIGDDEIAKDFLERVSAPAPTGLDEFLREVRSYMNGRAKDLETSDKILTAEGAWLDRLLAQAGDLQRESGE